MRVLPLIALLLLSCKTVPKAVEPVVFPQPPPPTRSWEQAKAVVIRHATVMPASGPAIMDGAIAFANGRIVAVGKDSDVKTKEGAEEIDGRGLFVTPGIIDAHSHLGVYATPATFSTSDGNEATAPVTAEISAEHAFWPQDPGLRRAAAGGITSLLSLPGSANLIGGRGFPVKLHFGRTAAEMRFPGAKDSLKMACGENPRRVYGQHRKAAPSTRMGNVAGYRTAFLQARDYLTKLEEYQKKKQRDADGAGPPPLRDLKLETLAMVLRGEILVQNHCYRADEMDVMLRLSDELGYRIRAFHHSLEAYKVRDALAARGVGAATWADWWGFKLEAWDGIPYNAALLSQAGAKAIIHSDSAYDIQRLNQEAAKARWSAAHQGISISEEETLRWITLNAAWLMGVEGHTGVLEAGKMADIVLWDGHPFSVYARPRRVWADGVVTYDGASGAADVADFEVNTTTDPSSRLRAKVGARLELPAPGKQKPLEVKAGCTALSTVSFVEASAVKTGQTVVIDNGRIAELGADGAVKVPEGCRTVNGGGAVLSPGFVDPLSSLGLVEIPAEDSATDLSPRGDAARDAVRASARAVDALNPSSERFAVSRAAGVLLSAAVPTGGLFGGQSALVTADGRVRVARLALHLQLGEGGRESISGSRAQVLEKVREVFEDARLYATRRADFDRNDLRDLSASRLDLDAVNLSLSGKLPVVIHADRESDIRAALALAKELSLRAVIAGGAEAWRVAEDLAKGNVAVILEPTRNLPESFDSLHNRDDAAALLHAAGVKVCFSTLGEVSRTPALGQLAGNAVATGMPWTAAYAAVTTNALEALGLPSPKIARGAAADLVLWSGDPLELGARPLGVWIEGVQQSLDTRHDRLLQKYRAAK